MKKRLLLVLFFLFFFVSLGNTWEATPCFYFDRSNLNFSKIENFDHITMNNLGITFKTGEPQLPLKVVYLIIPPGFNVTKIEIITINSDTLGGNYIVYPVQQPVILSLTDDQIEFTKPKSEIYRSSTIYPQKIIEYAGNTNFGGTTIAGFFIFPVQYLPAQQQLVFHSFIQIKITAEPDDKKFITSKNRTIAQKRVHQQSIAGLITNIEHRIKSDNKKVGYTSEECQYLIITNKSLMNNFKPLADWKTQKGIPAQIITVQSIRNNYYGSDDAERVRECIKDYYQNHGTIWVLLGGDTNIVPYRTAFAMTCGHYYNPSEDELPCDLYFSDLDGNWDRNGNGRFGEVADSVDLSPEVFVGRAAVGTTAEADAFIAKVLTYEKPSALDYQKNLLFAAEILWNNPYTDAGLGKELIEQENIPPNVYHITKLYESLGNESSFSVTTKLNSGQNIFNHDGHAWYSLMSVGNGSLTISDMENLRNDPRNGIIFSIGCWPAAFDYNCIAEAFLTNPQGGGVAFIGNSRYGWGSPGNPGYGYSDRFDHQFYQVLFHDKISNIGATLALSKAQFIAYSKQQNVYRWCMYELNLLGDPEMAIWTDNPKNLFVMHPDSITAGSCKINVQVTDNGSPVRNALVCLMQGTDVYQYGTTDLAGQISFSIATSNSSDPIIVTVTAKNFIPWESTIKVIANAAHVRCSNVKIDDSEGNGDGLINPGESVALFLTLKNYGSQPAKNVQAYLSCQDTSIVIADSLLSIGDLAAGDSITNSASIKLSADQNCSNGNVFYLTLHIQSSTGDKWADILPITIAAPVISLMELHANDQYGGNGNNLPEPGENLSLYVNLKNTGLAPAINVTAQIMSNDQYLDLLPKIDTLANLSPQETAVASFDITIADSCPQVYFPVIKLDISANNNYSFNNSFILSIGDIGFEDDMENGTGQWELQFPSNNDWHLTSLRAHSRSHSWYCGNEQSQKYRSNYQAILITPYFFLGPEAQLSFWTWYDVPVYRQPGYSGDGFYVEIFNETFNKTLDWIGSGGDLDSMLMGHDWAEYTYDLADVPFGGVPVRVKFTFESDPAEELEGVYIDDIRIGSSLVSAFDKHTLPQSLMPNQISLDQNYPNPFNCSTKIKYQISGGSKYYVRLDIFNIMGQKIKTFVNKRQEPGYYTIIWDGTDDYKQPVTTGLYFYLLTANNSKLSRKLIILR